MDGCRYRKGPYRGDVSALCLTSCHPNRRLLLAGTGPHVLLYDILTGTLLSSIYAFDGVRVHGICCGSALKEDIHPISSKVETFTVLVHGERRVKVFQMVCLHSGEGPQLKLWEALPRFSHWVMDVRLLPNKHSRRQTSDAIGAEEVMLLAVGLSNNTICLWDLLNSVILYRVKCSGSHQEIWSYVALADSEHNVAERLLLYSMRLWGDSPENLLAGVGTIFNEVLVWKLGRHVAAAEESSRRLTLLRRKAQGGLEVLGEVSEHRSSEPVSAIEDVVEPLQRLVGHEGSIYRLTWSSDGLTLASVSDDRSARVWRSGGREGPSCDQWVAPVKVGPVLYGHGARLWDCHVSQKVFITASEDCTCRIWTSDGKWLATLKGHQGRGIWRCVYDPDLNIVVSAGADSSIKIQSLDKLSTRVDTGVLEKHSDSKARGSRSKQEVFSIDPVWSDALAKESGYLDSKSEYVRTLRLRDHSTIYVGTNQGRVYHVQISQNHEPSWKKVLDSPGAPVVCMDIVELRNRSEDLHDVGDHPSEDMVVVGDGKGNVTAIRVRTEAQMECVWRCKWAAEKERQLLEVFLCRPFEGRYVFTADPKGTFTFWRMPSSDINYCSSNKDSVSGPSTNVDTKVARKKAEEYAVLLAWGKCAYGRIVCMDVCINQQLLVCGDKQGSFSVFSFPKGLLAHNGGLEQLPDSPSDAPSQLQIVATLKGAHGISTVTSVSFISDQHDGQSEIRTTGRDGCVCRFRLEDHLAATTIPQGLTCIGIEKVAAVSMLERLEHFTGASSGTNSERKVAVGFSGSDFLLWDTTHNSELLRVTCGGWRRPLSYVIGEKPDVQHAFVFVKGQAIQVYRNWVDSCGAALSEVESDRATQSLRGQFHGREINSVQIFATPRVTGCHTASNQSVTIATGAEDGTVILSSYLGGVQEQLDPNLVLCDHVGGSAVRSLTIVNEIHSLGTTLDADPNVGENNESLTGGAFRSDDSRIFLFSAGAKEVLTCWHLDWTPKTLDFRGSNVGNDNSGHLSPLVDEKLEEPMVSKSFRVSSQWLSTRMLQKKRPPIAFDDRERDSAESAKLNSLVEAQDLKDNMTTTSKVDEDDHRYLAMAAFAVSCMQTGNLVCFVVTASSAAALTVHAFHVATRSWTEVATLNYQDAPVLAIEHIVAPFSSALSGHRDTYILLTGATNGTIAVWDVTATVVQYMSSGGFDVKEVVPSVLRPLTGRGSQGGRRRKTREEQAKKSNSELAKLEEDNLPPDLDSIKQISGSDGEPKSLNLVNQCPPAHCSNRQYAVQEQSHDMNVSLENVSAKHVLSVTEEIEGAHQSGVNCMSVARLPSTRGYDKNAQMVYIVVSGGDDQAIHLTTLKLVAHKCPLTATGAEDFQGRNKPQDSEERMLKTPPFLKSLSRSTIPCAHSSAVKGVWTDGSWVFSTGLDQRLRCWKITPEYCEEQLNLADSVDESKGRGSVSPLVECMTCVIDTPEPASLHVSSSSQGKYHIAVVGRGLQVINFDSGLT